MHTRVHICRSLLFTHVLTVNTHRYALIRINEHVSFFCFRMIRIRSFLFLSPERETCQKFPSSFTRFVTRTLVRGLRRLEALTPHARGVSFFSSRDCAPLRVDRARTRSTGTTGNARFIVCDRLKTLISRVSSARNDDDVESSVSRSPNFSEILWVLVKKQSAERARTRTCVRFGEALFNAGTPLFLDARFCVSRSR